MPHTTRDGRAWAPNYLLAINHALCVGCGRCFKVCGRAVLGLRGLTDEGELVEVDGDEEVERKVMVVHDGGACVGCGACGRVCARGCHSYGRGT